MIDLHGNCINISKFTTKNQPSTMKSTLVFFLPFGLTEKNNANNGLATKWLTIEWACTVIIAAIRRPPISICKKEKKIVNVHVKTCASLFLSTILGYDTAFSSWRSHYVRRYERRNEKMELKKVKNHRKSTDCVEISKM